jgi:hypothetical protein
VNFTQPIDCHEGAKTAREAATEDGIATRGHKDRKEKQDNRFLFLLMGKIVRIPGLWHGWQRRLALR